MLKLCVIGDPVSHSRSPQIHTRLLHEANVDGTYTAVTVTTSELPSFVAAAKRGDYDGFNVTMPHKREILPLLDEISPAARTIGAVNTVVVHQGRTVGYNTDGVGFAALLPSSIRRVVMLGYGGAGQALYHAMTERGIIVTVCARHPLPWQRPWIEIATAAEECDALINATPLGMTGQGDFESLAFLDSLSPCSTVYDLVYEPEITLLLQHAHKLGHTIVNGLAMLQSQAELAFRLFTCSDVHSR